MMPSPQYSKIAEVKALLDGAQEGQERREALLAQRDDLEGRLAALQDDLDANTLALYRQRAEDPGGGEALAETIGQQRVLLAEIKAQQRSVDHALDALGDASDDDTDALYAELVDLVLEAYPGEREEYEALETQVAALGEKRATLGGIATALSPLVEELNAAVAYRERSRGRGFLVAFFGRNPRIVVGHHLDNAAAAAAGVIDAVAGQPAPFSDIKPLAEAVVSGAEQRWGWRYFDSTFPPLTQHLTSLAATLDDAIATLDDKRQALTTTMHTWIAGRA